MAAEHDSGGAVEDDSGGVRIAVLSGERRIRAALRALLETESRYRVSAAATVEEARALLDGHGPAVVVVGLGSSSQATDAALRAVAEHGQPRAAVVVGSRCGLDLDTGPDAILAAVGRAVDASAAVGRP